jgi:hypothetical protein
VAVQHRPGAPASPPTPARQPRCWPGPRPLARAMEPTGAPPGTARWLARPWWQQAFQTGWRWWSPGDHCSARRQTQPQAVPAGIEGLCHGALSRQHQGDGPRPGPGRHGQPFWAGRNTSGRQQRLSGGCHQDQRLVRRPLLQGPELVCLLGRSCQGWQGVGGE